MVIYPISHPDPETGLATINWIAEVTLDNTEGWKNSGWFRQVELEEFVHHFDGWTWDWLDVPALLRGADIAYENPMIDRDPVSDMARRQCRADGRRGACHVSDGLERREPGDYRRARARHVPAGARA